MNDRTNKQYACLVAIGYPLTRIAPGIPLESELQGHSPLARRDDGIIFFA